MHVSPGSEGMLCNPHLCTTSLNSKQNIFIKKYVPIIMQKEVYFIKLLFMVKWTLLLPNGTLILCLIPYLDIFLRPPMFLEFFYFARFFHTGCSSKFLSEFTATTHPLHVEEQLILARDPSVQSLLLVDHFCTANSSRVMAKERSQNIDN